MTGRKIADKNKRNVDIIRRLVDEARVKTESLNKADTLGQDKAVRKKVNNEGDECNGWERNS